MNEKSLNVFIDFGSSKIRLGIYNKETSKNIFVLEKDCISNFSFLRGASFPEELVKRADDLGYCAIAITDECSLSGVVRAHTAAKERDIKLIIGSEFVMDKGCHIVLLACNRTGYGALSHLISCARRKTEKGSYFIDRSMVEDNLPEDCLALWIPNLQYKRTHLPKDSSIVRAIDILQLLSIFGITSQANLILH